MSANAVRRNCFRKFLTRRLSLQRLEDRTVPTTFWVNNTDESGPGSLRQAVADANGNSGPDVVNFDPAAFSTAKTIHLPTGALIISDEVTITGPGPSLLTISGNKTFWRVIEATAATNLSGFTLTGG